ncbi:hypothetical protein AOQ84DRAFT_128929 [Glonium stellatum]|uniref:Uncharacterized protein n=1 Tax=Glonium stellatum TaxID=574774 RepID=A0A8E2ESY5_9PEZI|nr:hypothetical protein AOQ84DRAFT_128929 [Glonium stellatum]
MHLTMSHFFFEYFLFLIYNGRVSLRFFFSNNLIYRHPPTILNTHADTVLDMCDRDIITQEYRNCTNQPKHTVVRHSIRPCKDAGTPACKGIKDNQSFGKSTVHGGICPKC